MLHMRSKTRAPVQICFDLDTGAELRIEDADHSKEHIASELIDTIAAIERIAAHDPAAASAMLIDLLLTRHPDDIISVVKRANAKHKPAVLDKCSVFVEPVVPSKALIREIIGRRKSAIINDTDGDIIYTLRKMQSRGSLASLIDYMTNNGSGDNGFDRCIRTIDAFADNECTIMRIVIFFACACLSNIDRTSPYKCVSYWDTKNTLTYIDLTRMEKYAEHLPAIIDYAQKSMSGSMIITHPATLRGQYGIWCAGNLITFFGNDSLVIETEKMGVA